MSTRLFIGFLALLFFIGLGVFVYTQHTKYPLQKPHARILLVFEGEGRDLSFDRC
ncbi:MAG TPA: hypothetical protein VHR47_02500 [Bacillota bacterium]|nr:hypothetical protein [Bacillota bacterium]